MDGLKQVNNKVFWVSEHTVIDYQTVNQRILKLVNYFERTPIKPDTLMILVSKDDAELAVLFLACLCAGVPATILAPDAGQNELEEILSSLNGHQIIADDDWLQHWQSTLDNSEISIYFRIKKHQSPQWLQQLLLGHNADAPTDNHYPARLKKISPNAKRPKINPDTLAYVLYTSGSTGVLPKGVMISHQALTANLATLKNQLNYDAHSKLLNIMPLNHADGLIHGVVLAYFCGATLYRPCEFSVHNLNVIKNCLQHEAITHWVTPPTVIRLFLAHYQQPDIFSEQFKSLISTAGKLEATLWQKTEATFQINVVNLYGLTETVVSALFSGPDQQSKKINTIGKPIDCEIQILNDAGEPSTEGELLLRGENIFTGYYQQPKLSHAVLKDDWFYTGDLVRQDKDGFLHMLGRKKSLVICGGRSINPDEISACLQHYEGVNDAIAFGLTHENFEEQLVAAVETPLPLTEHQLIKYCRERLSKYKVPKQILVLTQIPKKTTGKIQLNQLRALYTKTPTLNTNATFHDNQIMTIAADVFKRSVTELSSDSSAANTPGWDSLGHLQLVTAIEQAYAIEFTTTEFMRFKTLGDAITLVNHHIQSLTCDT